MHILDLTPRALKGGFYYKTEDTKLALLNKMERIKLCMSEKVSGTTNLDAMNAAFDLYLNSHGIEVGRGTSDIPFNSYLPCDRQDADEDIYATT